MRLSASNFGTFGTSFRPVSALRDLVTWERIESSHDAQDWIFYLRTFPNGRLAEIAQGRLTRLLAAQEARPVGGVVSANLAGAPGPGSTAPRSPQRLLRLS
jgi:hypothetical protein